MVVIRQFLGCCFWLGLGLFLASAVVIWTDSYKESRDTIEKIYYYSMGVGLGALIINTYTAVSFANRARAMFRAFGKDCDIEKFIKSAGEISYTADITKTDETLTFMLHDVFGLLVLLQYKQALDILLTIDVRRARNRFNKGCYYLCLMECYAHLHDFEKMFETYEIGKRYIEDKQFSKRVSSLYGIIQADINLFKDYIGILNEDPQAIENFEKCHKLMINDEHSSNYTKNVARYNLFVMYKNLQDIENFEYYYDELIKHGNNLPIVQRAKAMLEEILVTDESDDGSDITEVESEVVIEVDEVETEDITEVDEIEAENIIDVEVDADEDEDDPDNENIIDVEIDEYEPDNENIIDVEIDEYDDENSDELEELDELDEENIIDVDEVDVENIIEADKIEDEIIIDDNTHKFDGKAKNYADARPSYPESAVDYILGLVSSSDDVADDSGIVGASDIVIVDIGAGTGKFSQLIALRGLRLYAVEPNQDMLEQLKLTLSEYPNASIIDAPAEATTLESLSVDIITIAQALCWFDLQAFKAECKRISKPDGIVISIYNQMPASIKSQKSNKKLNNDQAVELFFKNPEIKQFTQTLTYTQDKWQKYVDSISYQPEELKDYFDTHSVDGVLEISVTTTVHSMLVSEL